MSISQQEKAEVFAALHAGPDLFVMPNPWDLGSTRILDGLGFKALATTSAGYAFSRGKLDAAISRDEMLAHAAEMVSVTDLPVSADLENGYGDSADTVAETVRLAGEAGLVGCSIEDWAPSDDGGIYDFNHTVERVAAAVDAARGLPFPFALTARAENFIRGRPDLDDTIKRLQAFEAAGADVLYAPGLPDLDAIRTVCQSVERPVNVVMGLTGSGLTTAQLAEAGVRRVSLGGALARSALGALFDAASEIQSGSFRFLDRAAPFARIGPYMSS